MQTSKLPESLMKSPKTFPAPYPFALPSKPTPAELEAAQATFDAIMFEWVSGVSKPLEHPHIGMLVALYTVEADVDRLELASGWATTWGLDDSACWMREPGQECGRIMLALTCGEWVAHHVGLTYPLGEVKAWTRGYAYDPRAWLCVEDAVKDLRMSGAVDIVVWHGDPVTHKTSEFQLGRDA